MKRMEGETTYAALQKGQNKNGISKLFKKYLYLAFQVISRQLITKDATNVDQL